MTPKPIIFDQKHEKTRAYYKQYMANPENKEREQKRRIEYYAKNKERMKELRIKWNALHPGVANKCRVEYAKRHPERQRAQTFSGQYIQVKKACEKCGAVGKLEKHHADYSKPLEVITLCKTCHMQLHRELRSQGVDLTVPAKVFENRHCHNCGLTWPNCGRSRPSFKGKKVCTFWAEKTNGEKKQ